MKIIGGKLKGRNFYMPVDIRPTQNIARKALFDLLGQELEGVEFLDLFAGSGAIGLEALSRGAHKVTFVEKDRKCYDVIEGNTGLFKAELCAGEAVGLPFEIVNADAFVAVKMFVRRAKKFNIVFIDPPYGRVLSKKALKTLEGYDILHPNSTVIIQHEKREILPNRQGGLILFKQKKYGASFLSLYKNSCSQ